MTRARRIFMATALSVTSAVAVGAFAGQAAMAGGFGAIAERPIAEGPVAEGPVAEVPLAQRAPSPDDATSAPSAHRGGRQRQGDGDGYGYGGAQGTPPGGGELPETVPPTPPGGEVPTPPGGEMPTTAPAGGGVSPGELPAQLPVTGLPVIIVVLMGGLIAMAGFALRYAARRTRS
jgi:hypothetical protein